MTKPRFGAANPPISEEMQRAHGFGRRIPGWTAEEIFQVVASGNSVTDVLSHLHDVEIEQWNEQLRQDAAARYAVWLPEFHSRVAQHERLSAEDIDEYGTIPDGYVREPLWFDWFVWKGARDAMGSEGRDAPHEEGDERAKAADVGKDGE